MNKAQKQEIKQRIASEIGTFSGVRRRFDILEREPVLVVDDYAHHPTEVDVLVRAARSAYPEQRIVGVFQPHQHSRLRRLLGRFAESLEGFDDVLVTNVFHSRDGDDAVRAIDSSALVEAIRSRGRECHDTPSFDSVIERLDRLLKPGDVVVFMGAGTVTQLAKRFKAHVGTSVRWTMRDDHGRDARGRDEPTGGPMVRPEARAAVNSLRPLHGRE